MTPTIRKHAAIRIYERCALTPKEVADKLAQGQYYPFGQDTTSDHIHKIIHSPKDDKLLVVVQDASNNDVVTVLPFGMHGAWRVDYVELERLARESLGATTPTQSQGGKIEIISVFVNFRTNKSRQTYCRKAGEITEIDLACLGIILTHPPSRENLDKALAEATPVTISKLNEIINDIINDEKPAGEIIANIVFDISGQSTTYRGYQP